MDILKNLVFVGAAIQAWGIFIYIRSMLKGQARPNKVSWLLWSVAPLIGTAAAVSAGVRWSILPVFMSGFGPLLTLVISFAVPQAYWKADPFDYLCGLFSLLALMLWIITKDPIVALTLSIISDAFAGIPTLIKTWKYPETENVNTYALGLISYFLSLFAIERWNFTSYAFTFYLILMNILLVSAGYRKVLFRNYATK